jgi:hypothetical protein
MPRGRLSGALPAPGKGEPAHCRCDHHLALELELHDLPLGYPDRGTPDYLLVIQLQVSSCRLDLDQGEQGRLPATMPLRCAPR